MASLHYSKVPSDLRNRMNYPPDSNSSSAYSEVESELGDQLDKITAAVVNENAFL